MDTLTHVVMGACIGEAFFERGFGKKAMWWGAMAQSIADIDFIAFLWMDTPSALMAHRGFTHSIAFLFLFTPVFALLADRVHRPHNIRFLKWLLFFAAQMAMHLLLDLCNNYGMGLFEPFVHERYALNLLYVADPLFSFFPALAFWKLIKLNRYSRRRIRWVNLAFASSIIYLGIAIWCKRNMLLYVNRSDSKINEVVRNQLITPAPFQIFLWYAVLKTDSGFWIQYRSVFDQKKSATWTYHPQQTHDLKEVHDHENLQHLVRFSNGFYLAEKRNDSLFFSDLRFGQVLGWHHVHNPFVFHYLLSHPTDQQLVVQRGRLQAWTKEEIEIYLHRIFGLVAFR
jgi:inner membrane protein